MSKVKNVTNEVEALTALDEMLNLITEYQKEILKFLSGQPIASIQSGLIKPDEQGRFIKSAINWFKDWLEKNKHSTEFENDQLGMVIIAPAGIKSAMSHKPRPIDVQALPVLPHVIKKARVISITKDDTGKPIENIILAAPIVVDGQRCHIVIRLRKYYEIKGEAPRYYTQAVAIETNTATSNQTEHLGDKSLTRFGESGGRDRLLNVLHDALNVNIEQKSKKIKVYGWKAVEMARNLTFEQLEILSLKTQKEHFIPKEQRTNIYLYDQKGRKKLDVLSWAVHHKLEEFKNNPNENDKPLDHEDILRIRTEFQVDYEQGAFDSVDGFDSIDEDGQWVLDKIDSMIAALQNLHGGENKVLKGRSNNVKTAKGTKVSTVFAVLEADKIIASHTATGAENPNYPQELQPRDRSRESSQAWVQKTSNTLDPESLGRSGRADTGAPIVGDDLVVESGNGRTMAIQLAYERGNADEYKQWLIDEAEYFGFNAETITQFNQPILVRIRTSEVDRVQFTVEANQDDKLSFSATERAKSDAKRLDENLLSLFMPGDDGDLLTVANQKFIQGFLKSLGETEAAQYITKEGKPTQALVTRIKAAIFSKAYNDDRLLEMMADQTKPDLQNMLNALGAAAPKFIEAQSVSRGNVQDVSSSIVDGIEQALDKQVANAIIDAANTILAAKHNDQDIAEFMKQQGLFGDLGEGVPELAIFLSKNSRSAKKMSLLFKAMAEFAEKQALDQQNIGLFGDPEPVSIKDAIDYAVNIIEENYGENTNLSMFDSTYIDWDGKIHFTDLDNEAHSAATSPLNNLDLPSDEQKLSGEYQKGHLSIGDLNIAIENPAGSIRSGTDEQGNEWQITMQHHYGFIENTMGADGDEIDVFIKNHLDHIPDHAYIIKQLDKDGKFDEHKVILGAETEDEAKEIYLSNYEQGWQGFGDIKRISMADLLQKIQHTWSGFDSWATDGSYEHIPLNKIITDNAPKIHESKISKEDPIVVIEKLGKYHLIVGLGRLALAKQRRESFIPAIIFDANEVKDSIIQKAMKKAGVIVDPVALAALIVDELEKVYSIVLTLLKVTLLETMC